MQLVRKRGNEAARAKGKKQARMWGRKRVTKAASEKGRNLYERNNFGRKGGT